LILLERGPGHEGFVDAEIGRYLQTALSCFNGFERLLRHKRRYRFAAGTGSAYQDIETLLIERRAISLGHRRRKRAVSIAITSLLFALTPSKIAYQDLGALLVRQLGVATRLQRHLLASPFGTIHAAVFSFPNPIGTVIPAESIYKLISSDPASTQDPINKPRLSVALSEFPKSNGRAKQDLLLSRLREPMPPLSPLTWQSKQSKVLAERTLTFTGPANIASLTLDTPALAPVAFIRFCVRYPEDCKNHPPEFEQTPVTLTQARLAELAKINRDVNLSIKPEPNLAGALGEEWLVSPRNGDCNDYAVTKRHQLLARGWPSRSLLLAEVVTPSGEHHLVLVVRTRADDLVLDNLNRDIRPISRIGYQWVRAQQENNPIFWSRTNLALSDRAPTDMR
jgi:predicted transglutaminase-like cysteine proteinase